MKKSLTGGTEMSEKLAVNVDLNALIILFSYHHKNTEKIAKVFAKILNAQIKTPKQASPEEPQQYDLVGFGAGIDSGKHYRELLDFADTLPQVTEKKAFIFSTSGVTGEKKLEKDHSALRIKLQSKGFLIVDEFQCKGFNTNSFLKYFGGINKDRPNEEDLKDAEEFAQNLKKTELVF
jgi:flavodoxin